MEKKNHKWVILLNRIISEPRLENPYLLYSNTNSHLSPYHFSSNEYQQRKLPASFSQSCKSRSIVSHVNHHSFLLLISPGDIVDHDQPKDELSVHDTCSSCKSMSGRTIE